jgi:DNA (cytosine-5)-methyltransferase 1
MRTRNSVLLLFVPRTADIASDRVLGTPRNSPLGSFNFSRRSNCESAAFKSEFKMGSSLKYISFFSGALGLDIGLDRGGLECLAVNDDDPRACATIRANLHRFPSAPHLYAQDIRELDPLTIRRDLAIEPGELFGIVGGPPCQAFSTAGRRLGLNDDRGNVFLHFIKLIGDLKPKYAIIENVRGLLSAPLVHRPHNQRGRGFPPLNPEELPKGALSHILSLLKSSGYEVSFTLYNMANFGVPQVRERIVLFASRDGRRIPFMIPTHSEFGDQGLPKWVSLKDAVANLQGQNHEVVHFPEKRLRYYRMLSQGQNWRDLPIELQRKAMGASFHSGGGKTGFYRRLSWDKPSPTLVTSPTMPATDLCHPSELRPLSVQEYAAIQTFPDDFVFTGNTVDKYRQIGNAVPCRFGERIAIHVRAFDAGQLETQAAELPLSRYRATDHDSWASEKAQREIAF